MRNKRTPSLPATPPDSNCLAMADSPASSARSLDDHRPARARRRVPLYGLALLVVALVLLRCSAFQGCIQPIRIAGGSMADALPGPHYQFHCRDCGCPFRCGVAYLPESEQTTCPNCGFPANQLCESSWQPGRRVLIDRWPHWRNGLRQWQPVALRWNGAHEQIAVKRIVALGTGCVSIRQGNVFLDNAIQQKTLNQLREVGLLVHDDRYRPPSRTDRPERWQARAPHSGWKRTDDGYCRTPNEADASTKVDWLDYQQWACWPHAAASLTRTGPVNILDHYAYNQNVSRGRLHPLNDLMLQCRMRVTGRGRIILRRNGGSDHFELHLKYPSTNCWLQHNGAIVWQGRYPRAPMPWQLDFAVCDQRVLAAINGTELVAWSCPLNDSTEDADGPPLAIGAHGVQIRMRHPRILRDLHYLGPRGESNWTAPAPLGPDEFFVVGDNVPVSRDSRHWGAIQHDAILGSVRGLLP